MIRVIYRWSVIPGQADAFAAAWWEATSYIQQAWPEARGTILLQSQFEANVYLGVARWTSLEAWQAHRQGPSVVPATVSARMVAATNGPASHEVCDEVREWVSTRAGDTHAPS